MFPVLFHLGPFTIYTYGVLVATGVLLGLAYARQQAPRNGLDPEKMWNLGIYTILLSLVIAKVWLVLSDWQYYSANPGDILSVTTFQSGGTFYGGLLGAILVLAIYAYIQKISLLSILDTFVAALPLGHAIGRIGCFAAGCCYGRPTFRSWGVVFTNPETARLAGTPLGVHLHPTQLYEAAVEFMNFLILIWIGRRRRFKGQIVGAYFILYGIERGVIEFFRGDPGRTLMFNGTVSLMQLVSAILIFSGIVLWWRGLRGYASRVTIAPIQP